MGVIGRNFGHSPRASCARALPSPARPRRPHREHVQPRWPWPYDRAGCASTRCCDWSGGVLERRAPVRRVVDEPAPFAKEPRVGPRLELDRDGSGSRGSGSGARSGCSTADREDQRERTGRAAACRDSSRSRSRSAASFYALLGILSSHAEALLRDLDDEIVVGTLALAARRDSAGRTSNALSMMSFSVVGTSPRDSSPVHLDLTRRAREFEHRQLTDACPALLGARRGSTAPCGTRR